MENLNVGFALQHREYFARFLKDVAAVSRRSGSSSSTPDSNDAKTAPTPAPNVPFLIHCTAGTCYFFTHSESTLRNSFFFCTFVVVVVAGKDRTGWATALILRLLGVSDEDILLDFMASNCGWDPMARHNALLLRLVSVFRTDIKTMEALLRVRPNYLQKGFQAVVKTYGSWENYFEVGLQVDYAQLKVRLSEVLLE